jgi:hypothetical protein
VARGPVGAQALEMERDRLTDRALNLLKAVAGHSQTWQLGGIGAKLVSPRSMMTAYPLTSSVPSTSMSLITARTFMAAT